MFPKVEDHVLADLMNLGGGDDHESLEGDEDIVLDAEHGDAEDAHALMPLDAAANPIPIGQRWEIALQTSYTVDVDELDPLALQCSEYLLQNKTHVYSNTAEAERIGWDRRLVRENQEHTADCGFHLERAAWAAVEASIAEPRPHVELLVYIDYMTYDGVELRSMTRSVWKSVTERAAAI